MTEVSVTGPAVRGFPRREIRRFVRQCLAALTAGGAVGFPVTEVSIALIDDREIRSLNRRFRGKNKPTDVLTFPADDSYASPGVSGRPIGDIIVSIETARRAAREEHHSLAVELRYLLLHGLVHALGYDHETDEGQMNELELKIRLKMGLL